ncbi:nucleotide sugar transporter SLC35B4-like [Dermatophagoides pteronyssinus]|nr:UDP-xylose and UDP-N-acetylglucosamine transporter-like [Dermatophagoides pteronyssinus]
MKRKQYSKIDNGDGDGDDKHQSTNGTKMKENDFRKSTTTFEWHKAWLMIKCTTFCFITMAIQEQTLRLAPKSSNFISFIQHLFITICGLLTIGLPFGLGGNSDNNNADNNRSKQQQQIPTRYYLPLVFLSFFTIFTNNLSLNYGISIPLMMIFKSSSLVANMLLGMLILRHRYSLNKFISVIAITIGLILCTIEDYRLKHSMNYMDIFSLFFINFQSEKNQSTTTTIATTTWTTTIGIILLTASFLSSAAVGIYQEYLAKNFIKNSNETLYYVHLLSIPIFLITSTTDIYEHFQLFFNLKTILNFDWNLPLLLIITVLTQYLCIRSVYHLTTECNSLSVTLCLTNRKFLSLLFSIFYFGNQFTIWHWNGTIIVFGGTISFYLIDTLKNRSTNLSMTEKKSN